MLDPDGRVMTWNAGAEQVKGYAAQEIVGQNFSRFYQTADVADGRPQRELSIAAEQGQFVDEGWRVRKDGSLFWAAVTITAIRSETGELRGFAKLTRDVTERKQAEEAVRRSEALLKVVTESTEDAIYAKDCDGRLLLANPATLRSVGKPAEEIIGHTDAEFYDDPAISAAILENDRRLLAGGVPQVFEETVDTPNGRRVMWSSKVPWRDAEGRIIGIIGVSRDITERKQAEEELRGT